MKLRLRKRWWKRRAPVDPRISDHVNARCDLSGIRIVVDPSLAPDEWYLTNTSTEGIEDLQRWYVEQAARICQIRSEYFEDDDHPR